MQDVQDSFKCGILTLELLQKEQSHLHSQFWLDRQVVSAGDAKVSSDLLDIPLLTALERSDETGRQLGSVIDHIDQHHQGVDLARKTRGNLNSSAHHYLKV